MKKTNAPQNRLEFKENLGNVLGSIPITKELKTSIFRTIIASDVYQKLSNDKQHEYDKNNPDIIDINDIRDTLSVRQKRIKLACDAITDRRNFNGKFDIPIILSQNGGRYSDADYAIPINISSLESQFLSNRNASIAGHLLLHMTNEGGIRPLDNHNCVYKKGELLEENIESVPEDKKLNAYKKIYIDYTNGKTQETYSVSNIVHQNMPIEEKVLVKYVISAILCCYHEMLTGKQLNNAEDKNPIETTMSFETMREHLQQRFFKMHFESNDRSFGMRRLQVDNADTEEKFLQLLGSENDLYYISDREIENMKYICLKPNNTINALENKLAGNSVSKEDIINIVFEYYNNIASVSYVYNPDMVSEIIKNKKIKDVVGEDMKEIYYIGAIANNKEISCFHSLMIDDPKEVGENSLAAMVSQCKGSVELFLVGYRKNDNDIYWKLIEFPGGLKTTECIKN